MISSDQVPIDRTWVKECWCWRRVPGLSGLFNLITLDFSSLSFHHVFKERSHHIIFSLRKITGILSHIFWRLSTRLCQPSHRLYVCGLDHILVMEAVSSRCGIFHPQRKRVAGKKLQKDAVKFVSFYKKVQSFSISSEQRWAVLIRTAQQWKA